MSVYTPQQVGQQPYAQQLGQPWSMGQMQDFTQQYPQFAIRQGQLPMVATDLALRCAATAASTIVEQMRSDPQALMGIQAQGQVPPHSWSNMIMECARRIAPIVHTTLAQMSQMGMGQMGLMGQQPYWSQQGLTSQMGQQPQFGQMPSMGIGMGM